MRWLRILLLCTLKLGLDTDLKLGETMGVNDEGLVATYPHRSQVMKFDWKLTTEVHARTGRTMYNVCTDLSRGMCSFRMNSMRTHSRMLSGVKTGLRVIFTRAHELKIIVNV